MKIYKTDNYSFEIKEVEAERETKDCFFIKDSNGKERKSAKHSSYDHLHSSVDEAILFMRNQILSEIKARQSRLDDANMKLQKFNSKYHQSHQ